MKSSMMGFLDSYGNRQLVTASRNNFNPTPTYQTPIAVTSPVLTAENNNSNNILTQRRGRPSTAIQQSQQFGTHSTYRGQASALLDRHHQPAPSHARTLRQSVYHNPGFPRESVILREEDEDGGPDDHYNSNLGESFVSTTLEGDPSLSNRFGDIDDLQGGGVMDLLRQFQRAHSDNHGRGVVI